MQANIRVSTLIHDAATRAGNESRLAKMIEATPGNVNDWLHGRRPCPIEAQALMAAVAGLDVDSVIHDALLERNANTPRGEKLLSALGKGLMTASGAALITASASDVLASSSFAPVELLRCIFRAFL